MRESLGDGAFGITVVPSQATYLLWLDCTGLCGADADGFCEFLRKETGLVLSAGSQYGEAGRAFLRMNVACPRVRVKDGVERLRRGALAYRGSERYPAKP